MGIAIIQLLSFILFTQGNYSFGPNVKVNDDPGGQVYHTVYSSGAHSIAARGDTIYIAYRGDQADQADIYFSKSMDCGQTWSPGLRVNYPEMGFLQALVVSQRGDIFIAYTHYDTNSHEDIHFTKSTDGGLSFSYPIMVSDDTLNQQWFSSIAVDTSEQKVFVAWADYRNFSLSGLDIYFARSTNGGLSFEPSIRVDDTGNDSSWQSDPGIVVDRGGNNVYVTWYDERNWSKWDDIYFSRSTDGGLSFLPNILVNDTATTGASYQVHPTIAVDTLDRIFIAWRDERQPIRGCYFARSDDDGLTFGPSIRVTDEPYDNPGDQPSIAVDDSDGVYVVWGSDIRLGGTAGYRIFFAFSNCAGDSFLPNVRVDDLPANEDYWLWNPTLAINKDKKVFIAWQDDRLNPMNAFDIYFATGTYVAIMEEARSKMLEARIAAYPNPFTKLINIRFSIEQNAESQGCSIKIYDATGRLVKSFNLESGIMNHESAVTWDGKDRQGQVVPCGIYFVEVKTEKGVYVRKVIKVK